MKTAVKLQPPGYTQIPDLYLDVVMPKVSPAAFKVLMAISRKTFGWRKTGDHISLKQLVEMTGLSEQGVVNAINHLKEEGLIFVTKGSWKDRKITYYQINLDWTSHSTEFSDSHSTEFSEPHSTEFSNNRQRTNNTNNEEPASPSPLPVTDFSRFRKRSESQPLTEQLKESIEIAVKTNDQVIKQHLDPSVADLVSQIYHSNPAKFGRLIVWVKTAEKEHFSTKVIAEALRQFIPYAPDCENWWPYLRSIVNKLEEKVEYHAFEQVHEEFKRMEANWVQATRGGRGLCR